MARKNRAPQPPAFRPAPAQIVHVATKLTVTLGVLDSYGNVCQKKSFDMESDLLTVPALSEAIAHARTGMHEYARQWGAVVVPGPEGTPGPGSNQ